MVYQSPFVDPLSALLLPIWTFSTGPRGLVASELKATSPSVQCLIFGG